MIIGKITITDDELNSAVELWLKGQGVIVPNKIESIRKIYSYSSDWTIEFDETKESVSPPSPEIEPEPKTIEEPL